MTTKEYLSRVQKLEYKIGRMRLRAKEYELLSQSLPGQSYDGVRVDGTRNTDAPFVKWLMKKYDLEREIEALEEKLVNLMAEIVCSPFPVWGRSQCWGGVCLSTRCCMTRRKCARPVSPSMI